MARLAEIASTASEPVSKARISYPGGKIIMLVKQLLELRGVATFWKDPILSLADFLSDSLDRRQSK